MAEICTAAGILCLAYYLILIVYAGITVDFGWIWLAAGLLLTGSGLLIRYSRQHPGFFPGWLRYAALLFVGAGLAVFLMISMGIIRGMTWQGSRDLDYVVVLGAQVKREVPSRALRKRLEKAAEYADKNGHTILILSGGKGPGEEITEAECMRRYLTEHGILEERLILEERSTSTWENLRFSDELTGCGHARTGILSNNFHVYRAVRLAEKQGYKHAEGIAARSDVLMQVHYVVREVFALVKEKLKGNI